MISDNDRCQRCHICVLVEFRKNVVVGGITVMCFTFLIKYMKLYLLFFKYLIHDVLCFFGLHVWTICKLVDNKGKLTNYHRMCDYCDKEQKLARPKDYDPVAYVWTDLKE